jgi:hypothetical protein
MVKLLCDPSVLVPLRPCVDAIAFFQLERSPAPEPGFFPGDESVRVGLQVPEALLDKSFFLSCVLAEKGVMSGACRDGSRSEVELDAAPPQRRLREVGLGQPARRE